MLASARSGLAGGSIYDALIAATVRHAGATLLTRDERARSVYERMQVAFEKLMAVYGQAFSGAFQGGVDTAGQGDPVSRGSGLGRIGCDSRGPC